MNTTYNKEDIRIVEGEICITGHYTEIEKSGYWGYECAYKKAVEGGIEKNNLPLSWYEKLHDKESYFSITSSTAELDKVPKLERKWFVKPKVDVEELAHKDYPHGHDHQKGYDPNIHYEVRKQSFIRGFNANPAVYTEEDIMLAFNQGRNQNLSYESFIQTLHPLSIPNSITLDENFNMVSIEW